MARGVLPVCDAQPVGHDLQILDPPVARIVAHPGKDLSGSAHDSMVSHVVPHGAAQAEPRRWLPNLFHGRRHWEPVVKVKIRTLPIQRLPLPPQPLDSRGTIVEASAHD